MCKLYKLVVSKSNANIVDQENNSYQVRHGYIIIRRKESSLANIRFQKFFLPAFTFMIGAKYIFFGNRIVRISNPKGPSIKDIRFFGAISDLPTYPYPILSYCNHYFSIAISDF